MTKYSEHAVQDSPPPNDVRPLIDETDHRILEVLAVEARIPNNALALRVGIAPSTCLSRVRALLELGVIKGFHADIDPEAVGRPLQAMIAVRLQADARDAIHSFSRNLAEMPQVQNVFFIAGGSDFLVHVGVKDTAELREFVVVNLSGNPEVSYTETNFIFEHLHVQRV